MQGQNISENIETLSFESSFLALDHENEEGQQQMPGLIGQDYQTLPSSMVPEDEFFDDSHNRLAPALPPASAPSDEDPRSLASHMVFRTSADAFLAAPPMDRLFPSPSEIVATTALNEDLPLIGPSSDAADLLRAPDVSQPSPVLGREISQIEIEMGDESGRSFRDALSMIATLLVSHTPFFQGLFGSDFYDFLCAEMASPDRDTRLKSIFQEEFLAHWQLTRQKTAEAQDTEGFPDRVKGFLDLALQRIQRDWLVPYWNVGWVPMSFIKWAEFYPLHLTQCVRLAWIGPRKPVESIQQWNRRAIQTALLGGHDAPFPGPSSRARTLSAPSLPQLLSNSLKGGSHQPCLIKESDWPRIYSTAFPFSLILSLHSISSYNQTGESYPRRSARKRTKTSNEPSSSSMTVSSSTTSDISLDAHHLAVYQTLEMLTARIIVRLMTQFMEGRIEKDVPECLGKTGLQTFFLEVSLRSMQLQKNGA